ncbi:Pumilio RNA-binding repeat containing protein [Cryptosporidium felis]|nr:Pumilio RNA-binding repeat containing protein [Cryptosporidium felis]
MDDTKVLNEIICASLISQGRLKKEILENQYSIKIVTYLLTPQVSLRNFTQYEHWALTLDSFTSLKSSLTRKQEMNRVLLPALESLLFDSPKEEAKAVMENMILSVTGKELLLALLHYYLENEENSEENGVEKALELINVSLLNPVVGGSTYVLMDNTGHRTFVSILKIINNLDTSISSKFDPFRTAIIKSFENSLEEMLSSRAVFILVEMIGQNLQLRDFKFCTMWKIRIRELVKDVIQVCMAQLKKEGNSTKGLELILDYTGLGPQDSNSFGNEPAKNIGTYNINKKQSKRPLSQPKFDYCSKKAHI